jgi:hypothetical protein
MTNSNQLISNFYQKQKEFGYLQSINLYRNINEGGCSEYSLNISLCGYPFYEGNQKLLLTFLGVRNFKIGDLEGLFKLILNITNVSEHQMEGINYRVKEDENELFSFYCEIFEFQII